MINQPPETEALLARAASGDGAAWGALLMAHQDRLTKMVGSRMDARLRGRVDAADVVQEAFAEASAHQDNYFCGAGGPAASTPLFLWLRGVVSNKLLELHRHHLGTQMRDAKRERPIDGTWRPEETSAALYDHLTAGVTRPSVAAARGEIRTRLADALGAMDAADREVLALRHFEQLSNGEAAQVLGIQERAAAKRYLRALGRLKGILSEMPGGLTEMRP